MPKWLFPIATLIIAATIFSSNGRSFRFVDCPTQHCSYLPFIGNPPAVVVYELYQTVTRAGTFRFTGDVLASKPVYDVIVEVRSLDGDFSVSRPVALKASLPGQLNPFDIGTNIDAYYMPRIEAKVIDWKIESDDVYRNATIISETYEQGYSGILVTSEIRNDEAKALLDVKGVIWAVDQYFGIVSVDIADSLAPGETITFSQFLVGANFIGNVHVSAQGILQP